MLVAIVFFMSGFSFALVPLYEVFCEVTGLRFTDLEEKAEGVAKAAPKVDLSRKVSVQFITNMHEKDKWKFKAQAYQMEVHPGKLEEAMFYAENISAENKVAQAVPNVVPAIATPYFHKMECFCFNEQAFGPNEGKDMPLRFMVDPELPEEIESITLSYTFYEMDKGKVASK